MVRRDASCWNVDYWSERRLVKMVRGMSSAYFDYGGGEAVDMERGYCEESTLACCGGWTIT